MEEPPLGQSINPSQNQSTSKSQEEAKTKEVVGTRKITRNLKVAIKVSPSNTRTNRVEASPSSSSSLINRICSRWTRLKCKNFWSMCFLCMDLTLQLQLAKELILSKMQSVDFKIY